MLLGPLHVYQCPACTHLVSIQTVSGGNNFDAKLYSDGKVVTPMLPAQPNLIKCQKCNLFFWISDLEILGTYERGAENNLEWKNADKASFLSIEDYYEVLKQGIAQNLNEEIFIRQHLWWAYNDRIRNSEGVFESETDELHWRENLNQLIDLYDVKDVDQKLLVAEMYRNLSHFEKCRNLIEEIDEEGFDWIKDKILKQCQLKNRWVVALN